MDYNERAKTSPYIVENETFSFKEKTEQKWELRKKRNQNILMEERKKRILQLTQNNNNNNNQNIFENNNIENINTINLNSNDIQNDNYLNENDLVIKFPPLTNISNNINEIIKYLSSDNIEENKWIIWALRIYFEKENIPCDEYLILFKYNIHKYFESLLKKYQYEKKILNEIFFIITNLFDNNDIVNNYPKNYFQYFLSDNYFLIYQNCILSDDDELVDGIVLLLRNILCGNYDLIKALFNNKKNFFYDIIEFLKEKMRSVETVKNIITFITLIFTGIKNNYIEDTKLFILILDSIFMIYRNINNNPQINKDIKMIKYILTIYQNAITCKVRDENDSDDYFVFNHLFNGINKNSSKFILYYFENLKQNPNFYFSDISLFNISLILIHDITFNSTKFQIEQLIKYGLIDILLDIYSYKDNYKDTYYIIKQLLKICYNIIDSGLIFCKILIGSKLFDNLILYFSKNMNNNKIMDKFLNMFEALLNYGDKNVAENLNKRGIIKDGIFNSLQYFNDTQNEKELLLKKCKIILNYLNIMYDDTQENNNMFDKEDYLLCCQFKEILSSGLLNISEDAIDALMHSGIMNLTENSS